MGTVVGAGCWPGKAEGRVFWLQSAAAPVHHLAEFVVSDRAAEIGRFRGAVKRALADVENWSERQETVEARMLLQRVREALMQEAWAQRAYSLIDVSGLTGAVAAQEAARQIAPLLARSESHREQAELLESVAQWLATRLGPDPSGTALPSPNLPDDAVLAAFQLPVLLLMDAARPTLIAGDRPVLTGSCPLVWGVPGLGPGWNGRWVRMEGDRITLEGSPGYAVRRGAQSGL